MRKRVKIGPPPWETLSTRDFNRLKTKALSDLWAFLELIHFYGGPANFGTVHRELSDFLMSTHERRFILMPRGHLKSTFASTLYVMWRIYQNPNIRILVGTANKANLSEAFIREVKQYLENQELREHVWNKRPHIDGPLIPALDRTGQARAKSRRNKFDEFEDDFDEGYTEAQDQKVVWRSNKLQVIRDRIFKEPTLTAASVGSPNTGEHYDLVIFDDLVTYDNSSDPDKAQKVIDWTFDIDSVLNPRDEAEGIGDEIIILGTRYQPWDYYSHLLGENIDDAEEKEEFLSTQEDDPLHTFFRNIYENEVDDSDGYLWPEGFDAQMERKLRRRLTSKRFASQYLNDHLTSADATLGWENVRFLHAAQIQLEPGGIVSIHSIDPKVPAKKLRPMLVLDPAASVNKTADWSAIVVGGKDDKGTAYILDVAYGHWTPSEIVAKLAEITQYWMIPSITVEGVAGFANMKYTIREGFQRLGRAIHIEEHKPKGDKKTRIEVALEPYIKNQKLYMAQRLSSLKEVKEEFSFFPSESVRDDIVDATSLVCELSKPMRLSHHSVRKTKTRRNKTVNSKYGGVR